MEQAETKKTKKRGTGMRVAGTLIIWLALSLFAATIVAIVPNVKPCFQLGLSGCKATVAKTVSEDKEAGKAKWSDWLILVVSLVVAVRIMFPAVDPLADDTVAPENSRTT